MDDETEWLDAAEHLIGVLLRDNEAIRQRDWQMVQRLVVEKQDAGRRFDAAASALGNADSWPVARKRRLSDLRQRLSEAAEENERRLTVILFAQRHVMTAIVDAFNLVASGGIGYGRTGAVAQQGAGVQRPSISINGSY